METLTVLTRIREFAASTQRNPNPRAESSTALTAVLTKKGPGITERLNAAERLLADEVNLADDYADAMARIWNSWEDVLDTWESPNAIMLDIGTFVKAVDEIIVELGILTVPARINKNLSFLRVGAAMNFHSEFKSLLPSPEIRSQVLTWVQEHPVSVCGVVDVATGTITKAAPSRLRRAASWCSVAVLAVLACAGAAFTTRWIPELHVGRVPARAGNHDYVWAMIFAYAGAILHVVVAVVKQRKKAAASDQSFAAIGNIAIWIHVHEGYLFWYTVTIPIAAYGMILTTGTVALPTLFFLGYSIDSVLDTFLDRFETFSKRPSEVVVDEYA